jgi:hypothetical protein
MKDSPKELLQKVDSFLAEKLKGYDELKNVVTQGLPAYLANDLSKLRRERDKVLQRLGEQTYQLLQQGKLIVPGIVQSTYRTAQEIVERIVRMELDPECAVQPAPAQCKEPAAETKKAQAGAEVKAAPAKKTAKKAVKGAKSKKAAVAGRKKK